MLRPSRDFAYYPPLLQLPSTIPSPLSSTPGSSAKLSHVTSRSPIPLTYDDDDDVSSSNNNSSADLEYNDLFIGERSERDQEEQQQQQQQPHQRHRQQQQQQQQTETQTQSSLHSRKRPVRQLTAELLATYRACSPDFRCSPRVQAPALVLTSPAEPFGNNGLDNENNDLIIRVGDVLSASPASTATTGQQGGCSNSSSNSNSCCCCYNCSCCCCCCCSWLGNDNKYTVVSLLGHGTFGQVVLCRDETEERNNGGKAAYVAVKVLKNRSAYFRQGLVEAAVLTAINTDWDPDGSKHTLRLLDHFLCQNHLCIVTELLGCSLLTLLLRASPTTTTNNNNNTTTTTTNVNSSRRSSSCCRGGISVRAAQEYLRQLLDALTALGRGGIVHCDVKPDNVLISRSGTTPALTLIDFGSACFVGTSPYTYIQSRSYRAPEVILGLQATCAIDMWSLGCVAAELLLGTPLFQGAGEYDQLARIIRFLGRQPPPPMIAAGRRAHLFYEPDPARPAAFLMKTAAAYELEIQKKCFINPLPLPYASLEDFAARVPLVITSPAEDVLPQNELRRSLLSFLRGVLEIDPRKRWTAAQARAHPFLNDALLPDGYAPPLVGGGNDGPLPQQVRLVPYGRLESLNGPRIEGSCSELYKHFFGTLRAENKIIDAYSGKEIVTLRNPVAPHYARYRNVLVSSPLGAVSPVHLPPNITISTDITSSSSTTTATTTTTTTTTAVANDVPPPPPVPIITTTAAPPPPPVDVPDINQRSFRQQLDQRSYGYYNQQQQQQYQYQYQFQCQQQQQQQQQQQRNCLLGSPAGPSVLRSSAMAINNNNGSNNNSSSNSGRSQSGSTHGHYSASYNERLLLQQHVAGKADLKKTTERLRKRNNISLRLFSPVQKCTAPPCDAIITLDLVPTSANQPSSGSETPLRSIPAAARYPHHRSSSRIAIRKSANNIDTNVDVIQNSVDECMSMAGDGPSSLRTSSGSAKSIFALCGYPPAATAAPSITTTTTAAAAAATVVTTDGVGDCANSVGDNGINPWNQILFARDNDDGNVFPPITSTKQL